MEDGDIFFETSICYIDWLDNYTLTVYFSSVDHIITSWYEIILCKNV